MNNPGIFRIPATQGNKLCGEYYDASQTGQILYKEIEDRSLRLFPVFKKDIVDWYANKKIGIFGKNGIVEILSVFPAAEQFENLKDCDLLIDTEMVPQFRNYTKRAKNSVLAPSEILLPVLIDKIIKHFKKNEVNMIVINGIMKKNIDNISDYEKDRLNMSIEQILQDIEFIDRFCGEDHLSFNILNQHKHDLNQFVKVVSNGICNVLLDRSEENYNIVGGKRLTIGIPSNASIKVHMFGPCVVMGLCVADEMTICSFLQQIINQKGYNAEVNNHGLAYGNDKLNDILSMMDEPIRNGDSIIWFSAFEENILHKFNNWNIPIIDVRDCVKGLKDWFLDNPFHCNAQMNHNIAKVVFSKLESSLCSISNDRRHSIIHTMNIDLHHNPYAILDSTELDAYINYIEQFKCSETITTKGAVVINANPCTIGHLYLIQEALKMVEFLYVFLVEESKESLPYIDREYMLKESLKYNKNVRVIRGGNIMTSEKIFPEYFRKSATPSRISLVLTHRSFGQIVGPTLGVKYRFFGTEPDDIVTRALNESALEILPEYGIQPVFIDRLTVGNEYISAKNVRNLLHNKRYSELVKFVPLPTYKRLLKIVHDYNEKNVALYYKAAYYLNILENAKSSVIPSINDTDIKIDSNCYPGMFEKYGCEYEGHKWILKIASDNEQKLSLASEKFGQILCRQMDVLTSEIVPVMYNGKMAQLSKRWKIDDRTQFFPLAAYYEELLDHIEYDGKIAFKYEILKKIIISKSLNNYNEILSEFWRIFIIDYLLCNARSTGNIGFLDDGIIKLTPNYDNSTWLKSINDTRFLSTDFPRLLMEFDLEHNSAYYVLKSLKDDFLKLAIEHARKHINLCTLYENISSNEDGFLFNVIEYRYLKLFE